MVNKIEEWDRYEEDYINSICKSCKKKQKDCPCEKIRNVIDAYAQAFAFFYE